MDATKAFQHPALRVENRAVGRELDRPGDVPVVPEAGQAGDRPGVSEGVNAAPAVQGHAGDAGGRAPREERTSRAILQPPQYAAFVIAGGIGLLPTANGCNPPYPSIT